MNGLLARNVVPGYDTHSLRMSHFIYEDPSINVPETFGLGWIRDDEQELTEKGVILAAAPGKGVQTDSLVFFLQKTRFTVIMTRKFGQVMSSDR
jgi:hypothetical protein